MYLPLARRDLGTKGFKAALFALPDSYVNIREREIEEGEERSCGLSQVLLRLCPEEEATTSLVASCKHSAWLMFLDCPKCPRIALESPLHPSPGHADKTFILPHWYICFCFAGDPAFEGLLL